MHTQCPGCEALHEVHAHDLRIAQGNVRCGACRTDFNALLYLSEDPPEQPPSTAGLLPFGIDVVEGAAQEDVLDEPVGEAPAEVVAEEAAPASATQDEPPLEAVETPDDVDPPIAALAAVLRPQEEFLAPDEHQRSDGADLQREPARIDEPQVVVEHDDDFLLRAPRGQSQRRWSVAAMLLLLVLAAQLVHGSRDALVQVPALAPHVYRLYRALGLELDPHWDIMRYAIVRRPVMSAMPVTQGERATLRLVATVANGAERSQPLPLLRLTLEDRWGATVAARDFAPREYLHDAPRAERLLAPSEEAQAEVLFVDPGVDSVGFTLDLCLPDAAGVVHCANDAS